jgi:hypothetical protein
MDNLKSIPADYFYFSILNQKNWKILLTPMAENQQYLLLVLWVLCYKSLPVRRFLLELPETTE